MTVAEIILAIVGIAVTVLMAVMKSLHAGIKGNREAHDNLKDKQNKFETHVAENYVEKDDLHRTLADIKQMIQRLFDKIDHVGKNQDR